MVAAPEEQNYSERSKVVIVGNKNTGKTSIVNCYLTGETQKNKT